MNKFLAVTLSAAAIFVLAPSVDAAVRMYRADITHDQEPGGVPNEGTSGLGTFVLNDDDPLNPFLTYDVQLTGLDIDGLQTPGNVNDNVTRAHFHSAAFGANGGIVFGQIDPNNDLDDLIINPAAGTIKGAWDNAEGNGGVTLATRIAGGVFNLDANGRTLLYFNVHTTDHSGGEVRGQLTFVPEPTTLALLIFGGMAFGGAMRRRN